MESFPRQRTSLTLATAVLCCLIGIESSMGQHASPPGEGVYLNVPQFDIPFNVERTGSPPVEVQLFVSRDAGETWQIANRQPASARSFPFASHEDGTYWFATRTIDTRGMSYPNGKPAPQLKVVVDRSGPTVDADVDADGNGQIIIDYQIRDLAPLATGVRIEYRTDAVPTWMPVINTPARQPYVDEDGVHGRIAWVPEATWQKADIRVLGWDKAGNQTVIEKHVTRPRIATMPEPQHSAAQQRSLGEPQMHVAQDRHAQSIPADTISGPTTPSTGYAQHANLTPSLRGAVLASDRQSAQSTPSVFPQLAAPANPQTQAVTSPQSAVSNPGSITDVMRPLPVEEIGTPPASVNPSRRRNTLPQQQHDGGLSTTPAASAGDRTSSTQYQPSGVPLRYSRSKQFNLDYEVEAAGAAGVQEIELWGTRDGGHSWQLWGGDEDRLSPFDIEVSGEGIYGFRIVVVGGNGLASPRPLQGEPADIEVLVDTVAPSIRLSRAQYGEGDQAGMLLIGWNCNDENLASQPITISFAADPAGPWNTIAAGIENSGSYSWPADPRLPRQIFLRVEATDRAGNVGIHALDVPIATQGLAPRARFRGISPIESGSSEAQRSAATPRARFR